MATTTYPAGTPATDIVRFDRTTKVAVICKDHPEGGVWHTKDPFVSTWFGAGDGCQCPAGNFVTAEPYTS
jgi:hypothetical protein